MGHWWEYEPGKHDTSRLFTEGRRPFFFVPTRRHPRGLGGSHIPKHAEVVNPQGNPYAGRR